MATAFRSNVPPTNADNPDRRTNLHGARHSVIDPNIGGKRGAVELQKVPTRLEIAPPSAASAISCLRFCSGVVLVAVKIGH
jgi:hypothetical protein